MCYNCSKEIRVIKVYKTKKEWLEENKVNNKRDENLLSLAYDTIMGNVYGREGYPWSPLRGISPGKNHFEGIWNWDAAFHSVGVSRWDTELSKEGVFGFFKYQCENGKLPDVKFEDGTLQDLFSKPPVFAWACEIIYKNGGDIDFLKEIYPKLVLNCRWWEKNRKYNEMFYYDSDEEKGTEEYERHARFESGWDNSPRWDKGINRLWPVDLNCFVFMTYKSLSYISDKLSLFDDSKEWENKSTTLEKLINEKLWDDKNKYYADCDRFTGEISDVLTPASFMPLYIKIADIDRAECMNELAKTKFEYNMPTVSFDNPAYSTEYWRGPVWLNTAYFAAKGLKNYDFETADKIKENILEMCGKYSNNIYENYDARTGKGLCCDHFSWSGVFVIEFILNFEKWNFRE